MAYYQESTNGPIVDVEPRAVNLEWSARLPTVAQAFRVRRRFSETSEFQTLSGAPELASRSGDIGTYRYADSTAIPGRR